MSLLNQLLVEYQQQEYSPSDVYDKVSSIGKNVNDNTISSVAFGLEDSEGKVIKVRVAADQAEEFEQALASSLTNLENNDSAEIAEILFDLHDKFNIVDVEWPQIVQDEEQTDLTNQQPTSTNTQEPNQQLDPNVDAESTIDPTQSGDTAVTTSALDSVIQAMVADAEARRQESLAKAAEARAREAEAAAKIADGKLKAEEEIADMEAFYGEQQVEKQEAKKLAKLAKYRHQLKQRSDNTGEFNDYSSALAAQERDSESRVNTDPQTYLDDSPLAPEDNIQDKPNKSSNIQDALVKSGIEDEEQNVDGPQNVNRTFQQVDGLLKYLLSIQTRSVNDR